MPSFIVHPLIANKDIINNVKSTLKHYYDNSNKILISYANNLQKETIQNALEDLNIDYKDTLLELIRNGNEIGSHTYSHQILTKVKKSKLDYEINYTRKLLEKITNTNVYLTRPPYGEINKYIKNKEY